MLQRWYDNSNRGKALKLLLKLQISHKVQRKCLEDCYQERDIRQQYVIPELNLTKLSVPLLEWLDLNWLKKHYPCGWEAFQTKDIFDKIFPSDSTSACP